MKNLLMTLAVAAVAALSMVGITASAADDQQMQTVCTANSAPMGRLSQLTPEQLAKVKPEVMQKYAPHGIAVLRQQVADLERGEPGEPGGAGGTIPTIDPMICLCGCTSPCKCCSGGGHG